MKFRWSIKELGKVTDDKLIATLITERRSNCPNYHSPLYRRLGILQAHRKEQELTPNPVGICRDLIHLEKTSMSKRQLRLLISRAKDAMTRVH